MKNLEVMGIREMDALEMKNENGGFIPLIAACIALGVCCAVYTYTHWDQITGKE